MVVEIIEGHAKARMPIALTPRPELVEVGVGLGEDALDGDMQVPKRAAARHLNAAPDQRLDVLELNAQLQDGS